jgi:hypothetical protein
VHPSAAIGATCSTVVRVSVSGPTNTASIVLSIAVFVTLGSSPVVRSHAFHCVAVAASAAASEFGRGSSKNVTVDGSVWDPAPGVSTIQCELSSRIPLHATTARAEHQFFLLDAKTKN